MKADADGYPTICCVCNKPIVKRHHGSQHHFDHATQQATSWHSSCARNTHPFFCRGKRTTVELVLGSWFCSACGDQVDWVAA